MKPSHLPTLLTSVALLSLIVFSGCVGGGGGGGVAGGGGAQDPGQDPGAGGPGFNPGVIDAARYVTGKGAVAIRQGPHQIVGLPGVNVTVTSGGRTINQAVTDHEGVFYVRLLRGQHNAVRPEKAGYDMEPQARLVNPNADIIVSPEFIAKPRPMAIPGGGPQQVDDPTEVGNPQPAALQGRVIVNLTVDPSSGALDALLNVQVLIRDAATNRIIDRHLTNNSNGFTYIGNTGKEIIIEPVASGGVRWYPSSRRLRISQGRQEVTFQWRADRAPAARPTPRPFLTPSARPTPRPTLAPIARPSATPASSRPVWFRPTQ